jgi:phosphohistidine phosphatase
MKKLYILRHAKSDYPDNVSDDHERPLNKRGEKACNLIGDYLKTNNITPEVILSSDAVRTTQTINNILRAASYDINVQFSGKLYLATPGEILKEIAKISDDINSIMVVCHNPGAAQLAMMLTAGGDTDSINLMRTKYPTAGLACLTLKTETWKQVNPASGNLDKFVTPKSL